MRLERSNAAWQEMLQNLPRLGIGADAANPSVAKLNEALWSARYAAEGGNGDLRYTLDTEGGRRAVLVHANRLVLPGIDWPCRRRQIQFAGFG